jgi:hypothetical protein
MDLVRQAGLTQPNPVFSFLSVANFFNSALVLPFSSFLSLSLSVFCTFNKLSYFNVAINLKSNILYKSFILFIKSFHFVAIQNKTANFYIHTLVTQFLTKAYWKLTEESVINYIVYDGGTTLGHYVKY